MDFNSPKPLIDAESQKKFNLIKIRTFITEIYCKIKLMFNWNIYIQKGYKYIESQWCSWCLGIN